jgi:hypothetical protein
MTSIRFTAMPSDQAARFRSGLLDDYGLAPERQLSPGKMPCRQCLGLIDEGEPMLLVAYRPFPALQPYAETGPIFLHAEECAAYAAIETMPPMLDSPDYIVRGYASDDRIVYGTGAVTPTPAVIERARLLLARPDIAYVHVRSARNNCYQYRIDRAD